MMRLSSIYRFRTEAVLCVTELPLVDELRLAQTKTTRWMNEREKMRKKEKE